MTFAVPPKFMKKPQDTAAVIHGQVVLECEVYGVPTPSVVWFKNGEVIVPSDYFQIVNGNSLRILGLVKLDEGFYQCFAESEIGSAQATARLNVTSSVGRFFNQNLCYFFNALFYYFDFIFSKLLLRHMHGFELSFLHTCSI